VSAISRRAMVAGSSPAKSEMPVSMAQLAYRHIKHLIVSDRAAAGTTINEQKVAHELGISRTPVREALQRLQHEAYVSIAPRRGVFVLPISLEDMREIYDLLTALEVFAAGSLANQHPAETMLKPIRRAIADMRATVDSEDLSLWADADERFHRSLFELCGNRRIAEEGIAYWDRIRRAHRVALRLRPRPHRSTQAHAELVDLIAAGDAEGAVRCHLSQRLRSVAELTAAVKRVGLTTL
jgi:DNA-binding GntR family transcriptional regulator